MSEVIRHLGSMLHVLGWTCVLLSVVFVFVIPFLQGADGNFTTDYVVEWLKEKFLAVPSIIEMLLVFIPVGLLIWGGNYITALSRRREVRLEEQLIGFLKAYGRISLADLSSRLGLTIADTERYLASVRGTRDVVFSIADGMVVMPGFERSRPVKEIEKITREVLTAACRYCGALIPMGSLQCPECGAKLKTM